jgi:pyruvate,water dikinase
LATAIAERRASLDEWRQVYLDEFIPFAHGVRQLGTYYNDAVQPDDPYEFVALLQGQNMVASRRNRALQHLARQVRQNPPLRETLQDLLAQTGADWQTAIARLRTVPGGGQLTREIVALLSDAMDVTYGGERLADRPLLLLNTIFQMAQATSTMPTPDKESPDSLVLEQRLLEAVGPARQQEATQVLAIGRLSWQLRDDDNVLVGRLESQLLRALTIAANRLITAGRLERSAKVHLDASAVIEEALRNAEAGLVTLSSEPDPEPEGLMLAEGESPRQLIGQPASPGLASGRVRLVADTEDLGRFREGEVLVCDAIQPTMTHLVPLSCAIVERRGGMLIHGAIIARELGIPCVNGVPNASQRLCDGDIVTVDGYLGIVTVGPPEFDLETANRS